MSGRVTVAQYALLEGRKLDLPVFRWPDTVKSIVLYNAI